MKFSNKILSQTIVQLCMANEISHIVISPGSRSAPLTIGFTEHPYFNNYSIVDERSAAFFALGLAQQLKKPVALVCTSGSALLNYYPAIAEAYYSDIPLVVISADRPENLIDVGDGQTIRQENVFENHILFSANCLDGDGYYDHNEELVNIALHEAIKQQGPVHINAPFSEPLYELVDEPSCKPKALLFEDLPEKNDETLDAFIERWNKSDRKMILVGVLAPNSIEQELIDRLAIDDSLIVFTETTSNLHDPSFFPAIDQLIAPLSEKEFEKLRPEILLTFGGMVVSKKIKAFLRTYSPTEHWHVDDKKAYDTYFNLTHHFEMNPNRFLRKIPTSNTDQNKSYRSDWQSIRDYRVNKHFSYLDSVAFSDFSVFSELFKTLPRSVDLHLSNSATIRYSQLFKLDDSVNVFCNRGTSGIDGSMSTAIGAANASSLPTVFFTGDLSFFYDSNALYNCYVPSNFRIIVINNRGGGIFRILANAKQVDSFTEFFETKHDISAKHICEMYRINYMPASNLQSLKEALSHFYDDSKRPKLLEIFTPSEINDEVLMQYFDYIK